jgi:hypothetical protein
VGYTILGRKQKNSYIQKMKEKGSSTEGFEKISFSQTLYEINCKGETFRFLID